MAQRPSNKSRPTAASKPATKPATNPVAKPAGRPAASGSPTTGRPTGKAGRQSVAAARNATSANSNRTQMIIGGVAVVLIAAVVIIGLVINKKNSAVQGNGYGDAKASTATVAAGVISVAKGNPPITIEVFEDGLCPICGGFENQYGQQIAQYADEGKIKVNLHMLNFLNDRSASRDYSTRASAALLAVATEAGDQPGLVLKFHSALFAAGTQPVEGAAADLTNAQLADLAVKTGVPESVKASIAAGKYVAAATANAQAATAAVQAATGGVQTPTVLRDGKPLATNNVKWLTELVG